jgi:hypothetical protein
LKEGKNVLRVGLTNLGNEPLSIPTSLNGRLDEKSQLGSTDFLFSAEFFFAGSANAQPQALVASSDSDEKHSSVSLEPGHEVIVLLPIPAYVFGAKDVQSAKSVEMRVSLVELKTNKQEYKAETVRRAQSVNSLTLSIEKILELSEGSARGPIFIDLTNAVEPSPRSGFIPGYSGGGISGGNPANKRLPVLLTIEALERKAGKNVLRVQLVNQGRVPLLIPTSLVEKTDGPFPPDSTTFAFSLDCSVPGVHTEASLPLASSTDSNHSRLFLRSGEGVTFLLPLPASSFRAKEITSASMLAVKIELSVEKVGKEENNLESVMRAQSAPVTFSAKDIQRLSKDSEE